MEMAPAHTEILEEMIVREEGRPDLQQLLTDMMFRDRTLDPEFVVRAYDFAEQAHRGQERKSGAPYIHHGVEVARILAQLHLDSTTIAAGLLHDVLEDTGVTSEEVEAAFGEEVVSLVDGVTKITGLKFKSQEARRAETFRKMLLSMVKDLRVILIKFADRLHNMRTLEFLEPEKQRRIALETREVYAPLAHRLGIARIQWELEDLCLKHLEPEAYRDIQEKIQFSREEREAYIEEIKTPLEQALRRSGIDAEIVGRPKNSYSTYRKMERRGVPFEEIYDLLAIRILVQNVKACYHVLGLVHEMYTPVTDRFKDFLAVPKSNMYQSLHTTVIGPRGEMVEIQIRTHGMHQRAEMGIAAHWRYKEGGGRQEDMDDQMAWLRHLVDWQSETEDPREFMEELKIDLFQDEIFVFTPQGDVIQLPRGATPLDFAFAVHTDIGLHCIGAKVNGQMVSLSASLKNCDTAQIITSPHQKPHRDWLNFVKSSKARTKIRRWLREEEYAHSVQLGQEMMERELRRSRLKLSEDALLDIAHECGSTNLEHLYASLGSGEISMNKVMGKIQPDQGWTGRSFAGLFDRIRAEPKGVRIQGVDNLMISFAKCCNPVPGDGIIGLITRGRGVSVHRTDCVNIGQILDDGERVVMVDWDTGEDQAFMAQIRIKSSDRKHLLRDITAAMSEVGTNISGGELGTEDGMAYNTFTVDVKDLQQLRKLLRKIRKVKGVIDVDRLDNFDAENPLEA